MGKFFLPGSDSKVDVTLPPDLSEEQLLSFPAFRQWSSTLHHSLSLQSRKDHVFNSSPYTLRKLDVQSVDFFGGKRIGFMKMKAEIANDAGENLPGSTFLRGGSVAMMVSGHPSTDIQVTLGTNALCF